MSLSPQEKLEALKHIGVMPKDGDEVTTYGQLKADFLKGIEEAEG